VAGDFPAMKARQVRRVLERLGYVAVRTAGSHRRMECNGRPPLTISFHDGDEVPGGLVRRILVKQVGLTVDEAKEALQ
jgi:predicted RNA binding protein YcfA (HicA-like mRNA interferase family)